MLGSSCTKPLSLLRPSCVALLPTWSSNQDECESSSHITVTVARKQASTMWKRGSSHLHRKGEAAASGGERGSKGKRGGAVFGNHHELSFPPDPVSPALAACGRRPGAKLRRGLRSELPHAMSDCWIACSSVIHARWGWAPPLLAARNLLPGREPSPADCADRNAISEAIKGPSEPWDGRPLTHCRRRRRRRCFAVLRPWLGAQAGLAQRSYAPFR